jgi:purine-binding chemotaxis protein CheW
LSRPERNAESDVPLELACFELDGACFAVDVAQVREISRCPPLAPLPHAPGLIEGVVDLAGCILPILDLGRVLGRAPVPDPERARLAVLESDGLCFGLRIPPAVEVLSVPLADVEALPALAAQAGYEAVRAVVRRPGAAPLLVLSLEALLERVFRSARGQEEAA